MTLGNKTGYCDKPVFKLTDGVLSFYKHDTEGSSLTLSRGTWDFNCGSDKNYLIFFAALSDAYPQFILKDGTAFNAPSIELKPHQSVQKARFLVEGGEHAINCITVGNKYSDSEKASTAPLLMEVAGGTVNVSNTCWVGYRNTTDDTRLLLKNGGKMVAKALDVACNQKSAAVDVTDDATLEITSGMNVGYCSSAVMAYLTVTNNAFFNASNATLRAGLYAANDGRVAFAGNSTFNVKKLEIGGGFDKNSSSVTGRVVIAENAKGTLGTVMLAGVDQSGYQNLSGTLELKDDAEVTMTGYLRPCPGYESAPCFADVIVGDRAKLYATASNDADSEAKGGGGIFFGNSGVTQRETQARLLLKDNAYVETAARTTLGQYSQASNVLEVCGNATFRNTNLSGIILGRGRGGRGFLVLRDNGRIELVGDKAGLSLSGSLQWGDNLGSEERVDVLGGSIEATGTLSLSGTNAWVNLAGGNTSFAGWSVGGEARYNIDDESWSLPTNTIYVTGGKHVVRGDNSNTPIVISTSGGNARVWIEGGEVQTRSMVMVGSASTTGNPAMLKVSGGVFSIDEYGNNNDSQLMIGQPSNSKGRFDFLGGEVIANSIRGGSGASTLVADGGTFTVLNVNAKQNAIYNIKDAKLGENGLTVSVRSGLSVTNSQVYTNLDGANGLFRKIGGGRLVTTVASSHARTSVEKGILVMGSGIKTFGRSLAIASGGFVIVDVPSAVGTYEVLTLGSEMATEDLTRLIPSVWTDGFDYTFSQSSSDGVTTVSCTVTVGGVAGREVDETTQYSTPQRLGSYLRVTAEGVEVTFKDLVEVVGDTLVIDVPVNSSVIFNAPISTAITTVKKQGLGKVIFRSDNPNFYGEWNEAGGYFDIRDAAFSENGSGIRLKTDTLRYAGAEAGEIASPVIVDAESGQHRVVIEAANDLTLAGGLNSLKGGVVKSGAGKLTIVEPKGTSNLNTANAAASDGAVSMSSLPANGVAPPATTVVQWGNKAGAGLQILEGVVKLKGQGVSATRINNYQTIYIGNWYGEQKADAGLEVEDCTYYADGSARSLHVGYQNAQNTYTHPYLKMRNVKLVNHRIQVAANAGTTKPIYADAQFVDTEINTESGFQVGTASDQCHPTVTLNNTKVTQFRAGYAVGHSFGRDVKFTAMSNSLLNATYHSNAGNNWKGIQFESGAWGTIKFTSGSTLQTSLFTILNEGATAEKHIDLIFDDGTLDLTDTNTVAFAAPAYQGFTSEGAGMTVKLGGTVIGTFATPFRGDGEVRKTGTGTMVLGAVADSGDVFRHAGATRIVEGKLDLNGATANVPKLCGEGEVTNGKLAGSLLATIGGKAEDAIALGDALTFGRIRIAIANPEAIEEGAVFPVARVAAGGTEPTYEQIQKWKGKLSDGLVAAGLENRDGVIYAKIVQGGGMIFILK